MKNPGNLTQSDLSELVAHNGHRSQRAIAVADDAAHSLAAARESFRAATERLERWERGAASVLARRGRKLNPALKLRAK